MKTILVGLDGSARSADVLDAALRLARATSARLSLFRAVGVPLEVPAVAWSLAPEQLEKVLEDEARTALERLARDLPAEMVVGVSVALGTPWNAICEAARRENADLIVIGSHGYGGVDRVLGTTAAKVVNHADRSVLVVRAAERL
jgi:nucleotide-binding universal stress UspA family protein